MLCAMSLAAIAADKIDTRALLRERLALQDTDRAAWQKQLQRASEQASFCARCHGADGVSVQPLVPNLAGHNPYYLLEQIERFADGRRKDFIMTPLAAQAKPAERVLLAIYYSTLTPRAVAGDPALAAAGKRRYEQSCITCHGLDGKGSEVYARLAGQQAGYLKHRLLALRAGNAASGSVMPEIARTLGDAEIDALVTYLSSQP
jgi:cytochrome c553